MGHILFLLFFTLTHTERVIEPIIFVGGLGGQALECKLDHASEPHFWCYHDSNWFRIWMNVEEEIPYLSMDCFLNNMRAYFDVKTKTFTNSKGVTIRGADYGGVGSIEYLCLQAKDKSKYMHDLIEYFTQFGYERGISFRAAPIDWRFGPKEYEKDGTVEKLKTLVEDTFKLNGNKKVHLIGHSLGGPYLNWFLSTQKQEWKDQFINTYIPLGGPFDGSPLAVSMIVIGDVFQQLFSPSDEWRELLRELAGPQWMVPTRTGMEDVVIIHGEKKYTLNDQKQLWDDAKSPVTFEIYEWEKDGRKDLMPNVTTHCFHGTGVDTPVEFSFDQIISPLTMNVTRVASGDGTVPDRNGLDICKRWKEEQKVHNVNVYALDGVSHTPMVYMKELWDSILNITTNFF